MVWFLIAGTDPLFIKCKQRTKLFENYDSISGLEFRGRNAQLPQNQIVPKILGLGDTGLPQPNGRRESLKTGKRFHFLLSNVPDRRADIDSYGSFPDPSPRAGAKVRDQEQSTVISCAFNRNSRCASR
jgi:hypothetical protein